jgi:hypothetical protein
MGEFVCGACCEAQSYAWNITDGLKLPVANTLLSAYWLLVWLFFVFFSPKLLIQVPQGMALLLIRMLVLYSSSIRQGYSLVQSPVEAIRKSRQAEHEKMYIPSFYFTYIVVNSVYMVLEVILTFPEESPFLSWTFKLLCGTREAVDIALVVFVSLPRLTKVTRWFPLVR